MRILTGIQPSGAPHLGNYFGMIRPAIEWQRKGEAFYFIADYHAMTTVHDPEVLRDNINESVLAFLACGLDPDKTVLFRQSAVPEVHELAWYLSVLCPMGLLERCHSYKDKLARGFKPSHGLFAYPVLMAADILLYDTEIVPVGKDQKQHVEVARDLAQKFNEQFGEILKIPQPEIRESVATVPGLDGQKMSKSYGNTIDLFAPEKAFRKKIMSIVTDSTPVEEPKPLQDSAILAIARATDDPELVASLTDKMKSGGFGYGDLKKDLFAALWESLEPIRKRRSEWEADPGAVGDVLQKGEEKARDYADSLLARVRKATGISS
ncbi:MAG: tryptophan--tRNA ligase [Verrucomicrobiota bacterium]